MIHLYDDAILNLYRKVFDDSRIHLLPVENAIKFMAHLEDDTVQFPLVSTTRLGWTIRKDQVSHKQLFDGGPVRFSEEQQSVKMACIIPIRIEYQMDLFTTDRISGDEILREWLFYIFRNPTLEVEVPYGLNIKHKFNVYFDPTVTDNSDIIEHTNRGVYFRNTLHFYTDDAYLFMGADEPLKRITGELKLEHREDELVDV
ncbi:MAG: hypothetical protein IJA19_06060 [Clostridia bacterium]|nr:hypothetical protein [Clostridia bacterium]